VKLRVVGGQENSDLDVESGKPALTLNDVGGLEAVKRRLQLSFLGPLQNPALMAAYGKSVGGGLLLYGPPGCGKTFIARALAGELGAKFISVGLADILDMYLGESERRLHELFENARRSSPAVLFFDELDAIGQKRSHLRTSGLRGVVNQLLAEMDSVSSDNTNLYIIGATNHPWDVDTALKRPGRFDRMVAVFPPDPAARYSILTYHLRGKPGTGLKLQEIADSCKEFSGADLKHLVDTAIEHVLERSLESGNVEPVHQADLLDAMKEIRPSTRSWFETARNYIFFANESGDYDDLTDYMREQNL
jgi:SpoVK/Ycf46/Vps4 family AAA+-type ATPase